MADSRFPLTLPVVVDYSKVTNGTSKNTNESSCKSVLFYLRAGNILFYFSFNLFYSKPILLDAYALHSRHNY